MPKELLKVISIFFFVGIVSIFFVNYCIAQELEINYPVLSGGEQITPTSTLPEYVIYMFNFGISLGFLVVFFSLIIAGVLYLLSAGRPEKRKGAKNWVFSSVAGLVLLLLTYLVITTINPQLSFFSVPELLEEVDPIPPLTKTGVLLFEEKNCPITPDSSPFSEYKKSIPKLSSDLMNNVRSAKTMHNPSLGVWYIALLYDLGGWKGDCEYVDPTVSCYNVDPFASSVSIHRYVNNPTGNGITFYRRSFFNSEGGYFHVPDSWINGIYPLNLRDTRFQNVPEEEKVCVEWNLEGKCTKKEAPTLAGKEITSVKIDGNYFITFVHYDPAMQDGVYARKFTNCQEFPTVSDKNKEGPKQIKWEPSFTENKLPNYVIIFPVASK